AAGILVVFRGLKPLQAKPKWQLKIRARLIHKAEGHMNIPEKETFGFFDELGQRTKFCRGLSKERRLLL
ncbi:MAG: hypothetical protein V3V52_10560, partial [Candidatus Adiutricales bacterium]